MTSEEATTNCLNIAAEFGIDSEQYQEAKHQMIVAGRRAMKALTKTERVINFLYKIQWILRQKKF